MLTRAIVAPGGAAFAQGFKEAVVAVGDTNHGLTTLAAVDGVALSDGDRVLLVGQTDASENGIWEAHAGAWTRPADWQTGTVAAGEIIPVSAGGTNYGSTLWTVATANPITVDTTNVFIVQLGLARAKRVYTFFVENPISGDDIPRFFVPRAFHVEEIRALKIGGGAGSFDWELRFDPDASMTGGGTLLESAAGVTNNTTGAQYLPPFDPGDPAIIPAGYWVWLELTAVSTGLSRPIAVTVEMIGTEQV